MSPTLGNKPRILFLFSDTGGGHRSASEAIIEAINLEFPDQIKTEMVDIFLQYGPPPINLAPRIYPTLSRMPNMWGWGYRISDNPRRTRVAYSMLWPYVRRSLDRLIVEHPSSLIVSVHQLINNPVSHIAAKYHIPFATVVTDLVSTHAAWYCNRAALVVVPTLAAQRRGLEAGLRPEQMRLVGLPVAERFRQVGEDRFALRERLGWRQDLPAVVLVGGGEGMGPLGDMARAINQACLPLQMIIVAGRNQALHTQLENYSWNIPVKVYGFVRNMPDFMQAANVLVTKAGPGTISEAFIAGLPIILYSRLPGQEEGNVDYVVDEGAGIWAPEPRKVVAALQNWLDHPDELQKASQTALHLARPDAARQIARLLVEKAVVPQNKMLLWDNRCLK